MSAATRARTAAGAARAPAASLVAALACGAPAGMVATGAPTGDCLGRLCLGMSEPEALAALGAAGRPAQADGRFCFHLEDGGLDLSFRVAYRGGERRVVAILATTQPHCGAPDGGAADGGGASGREGSRGAILRDAGVLADCRGVRPGDPEPFVAKMHRRAAPIAAPDPIWDTAPAGVRGLADRCEPAAADGPETRLYLRDGRVVGLAVTRP
jgi:hypothetical protein